MAAELVNKAQTASDKEKVRKHPRLARASARLAVAVEALFESDGWGGPDEAPRVSEVWEAIEAVVSRSELRAALVLVTENVPPADAADPDDWRAELLGRYSTVSGFLKLLPDAPSARTPRAPWCWRRCGHCPSCWPTAAACRHR
jgi:hypothetical protein